MEAIFNRHLKDFFNVDFTIEFNVKNPPIPNVSEEAMQYEYETGTVVNRLGDELFNSLNYKWLIDWSFAGRSNGWFVLLGKGDESKIQAKTLGKLENLVQDHLKKYTLVLEETYN
jgi:hypothetical protein